jgi:hypothetical protein
MWKDENLDEHKEEMVKLHEQVLTRVNSSLLCVGSFAAGVLVSLLIAILGERGPLQPEPE